MRQLQIDFNYCHSYQITLDIVHLMFLKALSIVKTFGFIQKERDRRFCDRRQLCEGPVTDWLCVCMDLCAFG